MLPVLRNAIPDLTRSLGTAFVVWAQPSTPICPTCHCSPAITLPDLPRCPDCICQGSTRLCTETQESGKSLVEFVIVFLAGVSCGLILCVCAQRAIRRITRPNSNCVSPRPSAAQLALSRRGHHVSRNWNGGSGEM